MPQSLYNYILVLLLPLFFVSCSSNTIKKFGTREEFRIKRLHLQSDVKTHLTYDVIGYVASKENNCFESIDDRQVYTVNSSNLTKAINHFYFKTVSYNAKVVTKDGHRYVEANAINETDINLEVAYCIFERNSIFNNGEGDYVSFRLRK